MIAPQSSSLLGLVSVLAPVLVTGNTAVVLASETRPLPAITLAEVLATSDLPGGVVNLVTGRVAELAPVLAAHRDVDALDLAGAAGLACGRARACRGDQREACAPPRSRARATGPRRPRRVACWRSSRPRPCGTPSACERCDRAASRARISLAFGSVTAVGTTSNPYELAAEAAAEVTRWAGAPPHDVAVVLGSGWQGVADGLGSRRGREDDCRSPGIRGANRCRP